MTSTHRQPADLSGKDYAEAASGMTIHARCAVYDMHANVVSAPTTSITASWI
jgi:hypothetical protein